MKKWIWLAALALLLLPQRGAEVGKLLPVETLLIEKQAGQYRVSADTGSAGRGDSLEKAVDALRAEAPGILFLDTADYVLLTGEAEDSMEKLQDYVRPGTRVYKLEGTAELSEIGPFLKTHGPDAPLYRLQKREMQLPKLTAEGEKLRFEGQ